MSTFTFNKEKYLQLAQAEGIQAALTLLHHDTNSWEIQAFEGESGYQPDMWKEIEKARECSRELWEVALSRLPSTPEAP